MKKNVKPSKIKKNSSVSCRTISIPLEVDSWLSDKKNRDFATVSHYLVSLIRQAMEAGK